MWNVAYSKRLSGRGFPRHALGLGIVASIIPAEAPLCYIWEPVQALSEPEAILDVLKKDGKDKAFSLWPLPPLNNLFWGCEDKR